MTVPTFPVLRGVGFPVIRAPIWSTDREVAFSGQDTAFPNWSYPRYKYQLQFNYLGNRTGINTDWKTLLGFYNQVMASAGGMFQFNDPEDGSITDQLFGIGTGTTSTYQLTRSMGGFVEPVFAPLTVVAKVNGVVAGGTFDTAGRFTFSSPPAAAATLTWTGTYNWYCRFDEDTLDMNNFMYQFWEMQQVMFTTVKLLGNA